QRRRAVTGRRAGDRDRHRRVAGRRRPDRRQLFGGRWLAGGGGDQRPERLVVERAELFDLALIGGGGVQLGQCRPVDGRPAGDRDRHSAPSGGGELGQHRVVEQVGVVDQQQRLAR